MTGLRFVIVGTGRCGTGFTAGLLTAYGIPCGHETRFGPPFGARAWIRARRQRIEGDASWLAVPALPTLRGATVLHQVRHPLDVIGSFLALGFFATPDADVYTRFAARHFRFTGEPMQDAMRWWLEWNWRCEPYASLTFRVEDLRSSSALDVVSAIDDDVDPARMARVLDAMAADANTRGEYDRLAWNDLPASPLRELIRIEAARYGYAT